MPAQNKHEPWSDDVFLTNTSLRSRLIRQVLTRSRALSYPKNPPSDLLATKTPIFLMIFGKGECRRTRRTSNENLTKSAKIAAFWQGSFYSGLACQPRINTRTSLKELIFAFALTAAVTFAFYFILKALGTASTISVATSFISVYFTFRRSPLHSLFYASNDIVLIILWSFACAKDPSQIAVIVCFCVFLVNDVYGYISWIKTAKRQGNSSAADEQR